MLPPSSSTEEKPTRAQRVCLSFLFISILRPRRIASGRPGAAARVSRIRPCFSGVCRGWPGFSMRRRRDYSRRAGLSPAGGPEAVALDAVAHPVAVHAEEGRGRGLVPARAVQGLGDEVALEVVETEPLCGK